VGGRRQVAALVDWVTAQPGCAPGPGLGEDEIDRAERAYGVTFPPVWRAVLRQVLPRDAEPPEPPRWPRYPDWRDGDPEQLRSLVAAPVDGLLFDVEQNGFWWHAWGPRPDAMPERLAVARQRLRDVPVLAPIRGHWYVAATDDSPVFSIVQADLYVFAVTVADLATGRAQDAVDVADWPLGAVPFWSDLHAWAQVGHWDERFSRLAGGGL
jgi:hypothetical protein